MNLRRCFAPRQLLFLVLLAAGLRPAMGQESITLRNGQTQQATILGVTDSGIRIQMGQGEMVEPFANVTQVTMNPPPEFTAAQTAYENGDLQTALTNVEAVVRTYRASADRMGPGSHAHDGRYLRLPRPIAPGPGRVPGFPGRLSLLRLRRTSTSAWPGSMSPTRIMTTPRPRSTPSSPRRSRTASPPRRPPPCLAGHSSSPARSRSNRATSRLRWRITCAPSPYSPRTASPPPPRSKRPTPSAKTTTSPRRDFPP